MGNGGQFVVWLFSICLHLKTHHWDQCHLAAGLDTKTILDVIIVCLIHHTALACTVLPTKEAKVIGIVPMSVMQLVITCR